MLTLCWDVLQLQSGNWFLLLRVQWAAPPAHKSPPGRRRRRGWGERVVILLSECPSVAWICFGSAPPWGWPCVGMYHRTPTRCIPPSVSSPADVHQNAAALMWQASNGEDESMDSIQTQFWNLCFRVAWDWVALFASMLTVPVILVVSLSDWTWISFQNSSIEKLFWCRQAAWSIAFIICTENFTRYIAIYHLCIQGKKGTLLTHQEIFLLMEWQFKTKDWTILICFISDYLGHGQK